MDVKLLDFNGSKVLTYGQIAITAKTSVETLRVSFTRHKKDFVEGKDFIVLSGHDLRSFFDEHGNEMPEKIETTRKLYLWTRIGSRKLLSFLRSTKKQQAEEAVKVEAESKKNEVVVADVVASESKSPLSRIEYNGEPVLTTSQLADIYGCNQTNLIKNFNMHKSKFQEGIHFYLLNGEKLQHFKNYITESNVVNPHTRSLYLWTERGASRHCMIVDTDRAWQWFDVLEDTYFNIKDGNYRIQDMSKVADKSNDAEEWKKTVFKAVDGLAETNRELYKLSDKREKLIQDLLELAKVGSSYINKDRNQDMDVMNVIDQLNIAEAADSLAQNQNVPKVSVDDAHLNRHTAINLTNSEKISEIHRLVGKYVSSNTSPITSKMKYSEGYRMLYDSVISKIGRDIRKERFRIPGAKGKSQLICYVEHLGLGDVILETAQELFE